MNRDDAVRAADAEELARELSDKGRGIVAKVGSHVTNGVRQYQVNVTHEDREGLEIRQPYTLLVR